MSICSSASDTNLLSVGRLAAARSQTKQKPDDTAPYNAKVDLQPRMFARTDPPPKASMPPMEPPVSARDAALDLSLAGIHFESIDPDVGKDGPSMRPIMK
mmetsp:Transcript_81273/g.143357  ORF Transcript_81273/g.143357 Transcript_81273/m.143357 type:complete len:100 (+) Transcript_81273:782-1081(+)